MQSPYLTDKTHWFISPEAEHWFRTHPNWRPMPTILEEAEALVSGPRQEAYGAPDENLAHIAAAWTLYINWRDNRGIHIDAQDVCMMMMLLKVVRAAANSPIARDHLVDIAGYARCAELCSPSVGPFGEP